MRPMGGSGLSGTPVRRISGIPPFSGPASPGRAGKVVRGSGVVSNSGARRYIPCQGGGILFTQSPCAGAPRRSKTENACPISQNVPIMAHRASDFPRVLLSSRVIFTGKARDAEARWLPEGHPSRRHIPSQSFILFVNFSRNPGFSGNTQASSPCAARRERPGRAGTPRASDSAAGVEHPQTPRGNCNEAPSSPSRPAGGGSSRTLRKRAQSSSDCSRAG